MPAVILETEGGIFFSNGKRLRLQWSSVSAQQEGDSCRANAVRSVIQQCLSFSVLLRLCELLDSWMYKQTVTQTSKWGGEKEEVITWDYQVFSVYSVTKTSNLI